MLRRAHGRRETLEPSLACDLAQQDLVGLVLDETPLLDKAGATEEMQGPLVCAWVTAMTDPTAKAPAAQPSTTGGASKVRP